jgi:hypothetical protein
MELPLLDYPLRQMLMLLNIDRIMQIFSCILLEHQVILYSKGDHSYNFVLMNFKLIFLQIT